MKKDTSYDRYSRQLILKGFGEEGQQKLLRAKVLMVGAGGLGCAALQYLVAAGVGSIGIIDDDIVSLNNLHRQVLFNMSDIGSSKAVVAKNKLKQVNPGINITAYNERLTTQNALEIISSYDIIIDGSDNFATRYLVNDACVLMNKPLVYGAVSQFEGQVAIFNFKENEFSDAVNYRDLFPNPPKENEVLNCAEAGVLGILPGIIGTMQAGETIKLITGIGKTLVNAILTYNVLTNLVYEIALEPDKDTRLMMPQNPDAFKEMNYEWLCATEKNVFEIDTTIFKELISDNNVTIIDVREKGELPSVQDFSYIQIPLSQVKEISKDLDSNNIIAFCQTGKRSLLAAGILYGIFGSSKKIYSLKGGIVEWIKETQLK